METRAHYVAVGAFVLAVIFLAFVAVLWLGRAEFAQEAKRYYIYFRGSVAGLSKGSQVQYNGIPVGRVIDIRVDPHNLEQIQVTVEVDTSIVNIKSDAQAFLEANILNGIATVQIRGGTREASELVPRPGHKYAVITAGRSELEEVKASLPELVADLWLEQPVPMERVLACERRASLSDEWRSRLWVQIIRLRTGRDLSTAIAKALQEAP